MNLVELSKVKIREYRKAIGVSRNKLADMAKVSEAALRNMDSKDWSPSSKTLNKLEKIIPSNLTLSQSLTSVKHHVYSRGDEK